MMELKTVEDSIKEIKKRISEQFKYAFTWCIIAGLLAHLYMFMNKFPNYDDMSINGFGATFRLGRWFLWFLGSIAYHFDFVYSIPWVNGCITLLCIAISAGIMAELLHLKSKLYCALLGICLIVFPSWTATFFFMFTAPYYGFAFLLAVLSIFFAAGCQKKWVKLFSPVCLACSLGIYQAFLPFVATCYIVILMLRLGSEKNEFGYCLKEAFYFLFQLIAGVAVYFLVTKVSLVLTGQSLSSYKGMDEMGSVSSDLFQSFFEVIGKDFFGVFLNNNLEISHNIVLKMVYLVLFAICFVLMLCLFVRLIKKHNYTMAILEVMYCFFFVIAINSIYLICQDGVYLLMRYAYVWLLLFPLVLLDKLGEEEYLTKRVFVWSEWGVVTALLAGGFSYIHLANAEYFTMQLSFEQAKSYYTTVITQIKDMEGYQTDMLVSFIGYGNIEDESLYKNQIMEVFRMSGRDEVLAQAYSIGDFLKYYCGFETEFFDIDETKYDEISEMPVYPEDGSIRIVDGNVVVKFSE